MINPRAQIIAQFLADAGWGAATIAPLAGDASNRRYSRLDLADERAVLMDAPAERGEDIRPFTFMTRWLRDQGLSAPKIFAEDKNTGLLLLEDLGDALFARHVSTHPDEERNLYAEAVRVLVSLARQPVPAYLAPYDRAALDREALLFTEWWLPASTGATPSEAMQAAYLGLVHKATESVEPVRDVVVLRDYHAENLIWLPDRPAPACVGLLDYQDALAGHPAYDLMSLLEDARRDTTPALRDEMITLYLSERPDIDADSFCAAYSALGAQRNLKIIGIFARLALRDHKPHYLDLIPRVWGHLQRDLSHPDLVALKEWVATTAPAPTTEVLARIAGKIPA